MSAFPLITFFTFSMDSSPGRLEVRGGFEEPHLLIKSLVSGTEISPNFLFVCMYGSSGLASVMVRPWKDDNYPKIGN